MCKFCDELHLAAEFIDALDWEYSDMCSIRIQSIADAFSEALQQDRLKDNAFLLR